MRPSAARNSCSCLCSPSTVSISPAAPIILALKVSHIARNAAFSSSAPPPRASYSSEAVISSAMRLCMNARCALFRAVRDELGVAASLQLDDVLARRLSVDCGGDRRADCVRCPPHGIVVQMRVLRRCRRRGVTEELADDGEAQPSASADAGKAVAQIVQPKPLEPGPTAYERPRPLEVGSGLGRIGAGDDVIAETGQGGQNLGQGR
jgi:hypothetical protein